MPEQLENVVNPAVVQGEAPSQTDVDTAVEQIPQPVNGPPEGVKYHEGPDPVRQVPKFKDADQEFLFGPTDQPGVTGAGVSVGKPVPAELLMRYLPDLVEAAQDPRAPKELHQLIRLLDHHIGG